MWQALSEVYVTLKSLTRYRDALFWIIIFPILVTVVMIGIFARGDDVSFTVGLEVRDEGWLGEVVATVFNSTNVTEVVLVSGGLEEAVANGTVDVGVLIPEGASANISSGRQDWVKVYYLEGDRGSETAASVVAGILDYISGNISERTVSIAASFAPGLGDMARFLAEPVRVERSAIEPEALATVGGMRAYFAISIIGIQALYAGIFSSISMVVERRKEGVFRVLLSSPIRGSTLFISDTISVVLIILISAVVILATGFAMGADYSAFTPTEALASVGLIIVGSLSMIGLGLLIAGAAKTQEGAVALANMVAFPMMFIGGFTVPKFILPESLRLVAEIFPLSRLIEAVRKIGVYNYTPSEAIAYAAPGIVAGVALYLAGALIYRRVLEKVAEEP